MTSSEHHEPESDHPEPQIEAVQESTEAEFKPSTSFILAFSSICLIILAAALDSTSLSIALPIITERLDGTAIQAFWCGTSFLVSSAVVQPVIGALSHSFGRKEVVLASNLFFAVGSLVAALSKDFTMMLVGRTIQGLGGGGIIVLGEILITDLVPLAHRGTWLGIQSSMWAIGTVVGPLMGGGFAQSSHSGWRWIFWINLPMIGLGTVAIIFFLKIERLKEDSFRRIAKFDWFGSTLFIASTVSFLIPITWGGVMFSWSSWRTLVPLILGAFGIIAFGFYERRLSAKAFDDEGMDLPGDSIQPIIRFSIFNNWTLRFLFFQTLIHGMILWSLMYFLPLYYLGVKQYTPILAAVAVLPETFLIAPMAIIAGILCSKTGHYRLLIRLSWAGMILGFGILYLLGPSTSVPAFVFLNVPVSLASGFAFNSMSIGVLAAGRAQDAGHSITFYSFTRVFGQSLGVAVGGVTFQNEFKKKLRGSAELATSAEQYSRDATEVVSIINNLDEGIRKTELVEAYAYALKYVWVVMAALTAATFFTTLFLKAYSMEQKLDTLQGLRDDQKEEKGEETGAQLSVS